ncbi:hypothetical protein [Bacillus siamensis]|uniref:hypothetical protein n=1 Tax=Bacillus TaxID=1386 RepID=UPI002E1AA833|nr:hypothetical protein [Bacillus siamensis]MED0777954.1 hypothetical protein [Bacillus siamensis]MED0781883.1 hypothetical protein [Bacillus siamensis]MED0836462.1 hypothetical protein [Bacillus siamensis]
MMELFDLAAKLGITMGNAYKIAQAINAGWSLASIISIVSGVGSIVGIYMYAIKKKIVELGMKATAAW